ncbi:MAG: WXG100 family type VII secretion target [Thermocrispum sp.]
MTRYTFDFTMAEAVAGHMAQITKQIQTMLEDLHSEVQGSLAEWESSAREAYNVAKAEWDAAAARMPDALAKGQAALTQISGGYSQVETHGVNMWSR